MTITLILGDSTEHVFIVPKGCKHKKSWIMRQMPYGTDFYNCRWI